MSKRLLLADDSITIQKVIGITFANEDYQLDIVDNGNDALEHARLQKPDLILADVYMPGRNGYELCAEVKRDPLLGAVPVILLTGTFEPFDEDKAVQAGADSWIAKPFESQVLVDRVEELLDKAASAPAPVAAEPLVAEPAEPEVAQAEEALLVEEPRVPEEESQVAADDDIWGDVSFDEEDLVGDLEAETLAEAGPIGVEAPSPMAGDAAEAAEELDSPWEEESDDIFDLDDEDIIDEADLLEDFAEPEPVAEVGLVDDVAATPEPDFAAAGAEEELPPVEEQVDFAEGELPTLEDELVLEDELADEEPEMLLESSEPLQEELPDETWAALDEEETFVAAEPEVPAVAAAGLDEAFAGAEPVVAAEAEDEADVEQSAPEAAPVAAVEPGSALDEQEVARIVERVAAEIVERLAGTLLERIAWEVVPDLAENLIKDEIRKIKEEAH